METNTASPSFTDEGWQTDPGVPNLYITLEKKAGEIWKWENGNEYTSFGNEWEYGIYQFTIQDPGEYRLRVQVFQNLTAVDPWPEWIVQALGDPKNNDVKDHKMLITITAQSPATQIINMAYQEETDLPEAVDDLVAKRDLGIGIPTYSINVRSNDTPGAGLTVVGVSRQFEPSSVLEIPGDDFSSDIRVSGGNVVYQPSPSWINFEGFIFSYTVEDGNGKRDFAKVFLETEKMELTANDDRVFIGVNAVANLIDVLRNDIDPDPHLTFQIIELPTTTTQGGTLTTDTDNKKVYYTPLNNFSGLDSFEYEILSLGGETAGPATVTIQVGNPLNPNPPVAIGVLALIHNLLNLFEYSPEAIHLLEILRQHKNEILYLLNNQSGEQTSAKLFDDFTGSYTGSSTKAAGTVETEAAFASLISALEPGIKALLTGNGDAVIVTQELVDAIKGLQTSVEAVASDQLNADIQEIAAMFNNLDDFVGKNFNQAIELLGVDPNSSGIIAFDPNLGDGKFSITTFAAADLNFKLWKSLTLTPDSWQEVTNAEVVEDGLYKTLSDPNPGGNRIFYRLTNN